MRARDSRGRIWIALALGALLPIAACAGEDATTDRADELRVDGEEAGAQLAAQAEAQATTPEAQTLIAELAAGIVCALNDGEVQMSAAPAYKAATFDVREYAERMVRDHSKASAELNTLLQEQGLLPKASPVSVALGVEATITAVELATLTPAELDVVYMEKQVFGHAKAHVLVSLLAVGVENEALRGFFNQQIATIDQHLLRAIYVLRELYARREAA